MLKHGLISTEKHWAELVSFDLDDIDYLQLQEMVAQSVAIKENVVAQDPYEQGIRKALNLGHTAGHALESLALAEERTVLHGYAVAWGLVCELYLSCLREDFQKTSYARLQSSSKGTTVCSLSTARRTKRYTNSCPRQKKHVGRGQLHTIGRHRRYPYQPYSRKGRNLQHVGLLP